MKIILATHNSYKVAEIKQILSDLPSEILSLDNFPSVGEIVEDGKSFEENARKKSKSVFEIIHRSNPEMGEFLALADDSGLEVDALGGRPGVYSARYSGENATYGQNNEKLLSELMSVTKEWRGARFRCVISVYGSGVDEVASGETRGSILESLKGSNGFGYDPLFLPDGYDLTYAEMPQDLKNTMSHRAKALQSAGRILRRLC